MSYLVLLVLFVDIIGLLGRNKMVKTFSGKLTRDIIYNFYLINSMVTVLY